VKQHVEFRVKPSLIPEVSVVLTLYQLDRLISVELGQILRICKSRGSSGSIVSDYGLDDRGSIPDRGRGFFF
jgi:hypothetical protein